MTTKTAHQFLELVQRSGLITSAQAQELIGRLEERGVDLSDTRAVAEALIADDVLTRWQADKLVQGKHKGFFLGPYRLLKMLGKGGMGAVYLAYDKMLDRKCAIKVLPPQSVDGTSSVYERFVKEAIAVAALNDENIVKVFFRGEERSGNNTINYFVMEFVDGEDLQHMVNRAGVLDFVKAAEYIRQAARGLAHAHAKNLVHRDIKPANLLVACTTENNVTKEIVKILDLGLARRFDDDDKAASLTSSYNETVLGTADYLSPEQALNSHDVDSRTDIYSLGCTFYFLLTGRPPFPEGTVAQRLIAHQMKQPEPITKKRPEAPRDLSAIVEKMMAKKLEDRFQSASEIVAVLTGWLVENAGDEWKSQHSDLVGEPAMRAVRSRREPTRAMSHPMSDTELELAPLDDDVVEAPSPSPVEAKKAEPAKAAAAAPTLVVDVSHLEELEEFPPQADLALLCETDFGNASPLSAAGPLADSPRGKGTDSSVFASPLGAPRGPLGSLSSGKLKPDSRTRMGQSAQAPAANNGNNRLLYVVAGIGATAVLVVITLILTSGSEEEPPTGPSAVAVVNPLTNTNTLPVAAPVAPSPATNVQPPVEPPQPPVVVETPAKPETTPAVTPQPKPEETPKPENVQPQPVTPDLKPAVKPENPPQVTPAEPKPVENVAEPKPTIETPKEPPKASPANTVDDRQRAFADLKTLYVVVDSFEGKDGGPVTGMVKQVVSAAAASLKMETLPDEKAGMAQAVMSVKLTGPESVGEKVSYRMAAELKAGNLPLWSLGPQDVVSLDRNVAKRMTLKAQLDAMRSGVKDFFEGFQRDFRVVEKAVQGNTPPHD